MAQIFKEFTFEAAHTPPHVSPGRKRGRLHGHSFRVEVHVCGEVDARSGWLIDVAEIADACGPLREQLDHNYLNNIEGLSNPTSAVLAQWLWERLQSRLPILSKVMVRDTCTSGCVYTGPTGARL